jgi:hypothetical protein
MRDLRVAAEMPGVFPSRASGPMTEPMFRTETLHDFADYATSAH